MTSATAVLSPHLIRRATTVEGATIRRICVALALLAIIPHLNAITAGFTLDDEPQIWANPTVTSGIDLVSIFATPLFPGDLYRPLTTLTFALNEALTPGNAAVFHVTNLMLHVGVTLLVFALALQLFKKTAIALAASALFAVHPVHTEAVTSLVGRAEELAALFGLLSLLAAVRMDGALGRAGRLAWHAASVVCFTLAILSKESGLTVLPLIVLLRVVTRGEPLVRGVWRELRRLDWLPYVLCAALFVVLRFHVTGGFAPKDTITPLDNVLAFAPASVRLRSALAVLWDYVGLLLVPIVLTADYSYAQVPAVTTWVDPRCLGGLVLVGTAAAVLVRYRRPPFAFAVILPLLTLSLTANVLVPIGTVKAERLLYLPSVGWALVAGYAVDWCGRSTRYRRLGVLLLAITIAAFAARTWLRNGDWQDNLTLYRATAWSAPRSAKAHYNYAVALQKNGDQAAAVAHFERALEIYPWAEGSALGIGVAYEQRGEVDAAVQWYLTSLSIDPSFVSAHTNLCHVLFSHRRFAAAVPACRAGLRYVPSEANLLKGLGASLVEVGDAEKGVAILRQSLALNRGDDELRAYLTEVERALAQRRAAGVTRP